MVPIRDINGTVIGFGGRILPSLYPEPTQPARPQQQQQDEDDDDEAPATPSITKRVPAKYVNSPTSSVFAKGSTLYGIDVACSTVAASHRVLVVEGYFDVISLHDSGVCDAVGCLGTAFTAPQLLLAAHLGRSQDTTDGKEKVGMNEVVLWLDADDAGLRAVHRFLSQVMTPPSSTSRRTLPPHPALAELSRINLRVASTPSLSSGEGRRRLTAHLLNLTPDADPDTIDAAIISLAQCKDASDLCVLAGQLRVPVPLLVELITEAALDWRAWLIQW